MPGICAVVVNAPRGCRGRWCGMEGLGWRAGKLLPRRPPCQACSPAAQQQWHPPICGTNPAWPCPRHAAVQGRSAKTNFPTRDYEAEIAAYERHLMAM